MNFRHAAVGEIARGSEVGGPSGDAEDASAVDEDLRAVLLRAAMEDGGIGQVEFEALPEAERAWVEHVNARAKETLYLTTDSYYNGAEVAGKPRVFMPYSGGVRGYRRFLKQCAEEGYSGFALRTSPMAKASA